MGRVTLDSDKQYSASGFQGIRTQKFEGSPSRDHTIYQAKAAV
jgi:hypothetical protein